MNTYSFENFIVAPCNSKAYKACHFFATTAGEKYNPLIVCGNTGSGKTHLALAIVNLLEKQNPDKVISYVTSEEFANEALEIMAGPHSTKQMQKFRKKYFGVDVLVIDDIDWLQNKEATSSELFYIIDKLLSAGKKIITTSAVWITDLYRDSEKYKSRLESWHYVSIGTPDDELIERIIDSSCLGKKINYDVQQYIAEKCCNSIRKLQGLIRTLEMQLEIMGVENPTLEQVETALSSEIII